MKRLWPLLTFVLLFGCKTYDPKTAAFPFRGEAVDSAHYSLLDLLRKGPVLTVFIPDSCGPADELWNYYNLIAGAYVKDVTVIGLYAGSEDQLKQWLRVHKINFVVVPDWDGHFVAKYGFTEGPAAVLVDTQCRIIQRWDSSTVTDVTGVNTAIASLLKSAPAKVDTHFRSQKYEPCSFPPQSRR